LTLLRLKRILLNRYFLVGLAFVVWLVFLDDYRYLGQREVMQDLLVRQQQQRYYDSSINLMNREKAALESDTLLLERLAREKFRMHKPGESVFWFPDSTRIQP
jgi:cell division protein FtsB